MLDTHAIIWWFNDHPNLTRRADAAIGERANQIFVSSVSAFEIATKVRLGKLPEGALLARSFVVEVEEEGFAVLPLDARHAIAAGSLAIPHHDPFDRLLIAQAQVEGMTLVSNEAKFDAFGVKRLW